MVPSYQPETSLKIFMRALFNKDIATGEIDLRDVGWNYTTTGPDSTWRVLNDVLPAPEPVCYIMEPSSCPRDVWQAVGNGTAIVKDWVVVGIEESQAQRKIEDDRFRIQEQVVLSSEMVDVQAEEKLRRRI